MICCPHFTPTASFSGATAGTAAEPIRREADDFYITVAMVLAVYCPPHAPAPGHATFEPKPSFASLIFPAAFAPTASKDVLDRQHRARPSKRPGADRAATYKTSDGIFKRIRAIAAPGMVLSAADPWRPCRQRDIRVPLVYRLNPRSPRGSPGTLSCLQVRHHVTPSEIEMVLNSIGVPLRRADARFHFFGQRPQVEVAGHVVSIQVLATPIIGRAKS